MTTARSLAGAGRRAATTSTALSEVCALRGLGLWAGDRIAARERAKAPVTVAEGVGVWA